MSRRVKEFTLTPARNTSYAGDKNLRWLEHYLVQDPIYVDPAEPVAGVKTLKNGISDLMYLRHADRAKYLFCMLYIFIFCN